MVKTDKRTLENPLLFHNFVKKLQKYNEDFDPDIIDRTLEPAEALNDLREHHPEIVTEDVVLGGMEADFDYDEFLEDIGVDGNKRFKDLTAEELQAAFGAYAIQQPVTPKPNEKPFGIIWLEIDGNKRPVEIIPFESGRAADGTMTYEYKKVKMDKSTAQLEEIKQDRLDKDLANMKIKYKVKLDNVSFSITPKMYLSPDNLAYYQSEIVPASKISSDIAEAARAVKPIETTAPLPKIKFVPVLSLNKLQVVTASGQQFDREIGKTFYMGKPYSNKEEAQEYVDEMTDMIVAAMPEGMKINPEKKDKRTWNLFTIKTVEDTEEDIQTLTQGTPFLQYDELMPILKENIERLSNRVKTAAKEPEKAAKPKPTEEEKKDKPPWFTIEKVEPVKVEPLKPREPEPVKIEPEVPIQVEAEHGEHYLVTLITNGVQMPFLITKDLDKIDRDIQWLNEQINRFELTNNVHIDARVQKIHVTEHAIQQYRDKLRPIEQVWEELKTSSKVIPKAGKPPQIKPTTTTTYQPAKEPTPQPAVDEVLTYQRALVMFREGLKARKLKLTEFRKLFDRDWKRLMDGKPAKQVMPIIDELVSEAVRSVKVDDLKTSGGGLATYSDPNIPIIRRRPPPREYSNRYTPPEHPRVMTGVGSRTRGVSPATEKRYARLQASQKLSPNNPFFVFRIVYDAEYGGMSVNTIGGLMKIADILSFKIKQDRVMEMNDKEIVVFIDKLLARNKSHDIRQWLTILQTEILRNGEK
jgi:hypothetical protein